MTDNDKKILEEAREKFSMINEGDNRRDNRRFVYHKDFKALEKWILEKLQEERESALTKVKDRLVTVFTQGYHEVEVSYEALNELIDKLKLEEEHE